VSPVWLVLPDPFSSRLFFDTGIVEQLRMRLGGLGRRNVDGRKDQQRESHGPEDPHERASPNGPMFVL